LLGFAVDLVDVAVGFAMDFAVDFPVDFAVDFPVDCAVDFAVDFPVDFAVDFPVDFVVGFVDSFTGSSVFVTVACLALVRTRVLLFTVSVEASTDLDVFFLGGILSHDSAIRNSKE
jgi:hypothetical protein